MPTASTANPLYMKNLISIRDLSLSEINIILDEAQRLHADMAKGSLKQTLEERILATLFYEPSTRTRLSFESAMQRLGGGILGFSDPASSSVMKGESLADTMRVVSSYADIIVLRHNQQGAAREAAKFAKVPIINAGDGAGEHPTQALLDLFTIKKEKGKLDGLKIAIVGDLKNSRTEHSLAYALGMFKNKLIFIAPDQLQIPDNIYEGLSKTSHVDAEKSSSLDDALNADIVYINRIQKERFDDPTEYKKFAEYFKIDQQFMNRADTRVTIINPLPRLTEVSSEIDHLKNSAYFRQASYGVPIRMAILKLILTE